MVAKHMLRAILRMVQIIYHLVVIMVVANCGQMISQLEVAHLRKVVMRVLHMNGHRWSIIIVDTERSECTHRVLS